MGDSLTALAASSRRAPQHCPHGRAARAHPQGLGLYQHSGRGPIKATAMMDPAHGRAAMRLDPLGAQGSHQHSGRGPTRAFAMTDLRRLPKGDRPATLTDLRRAGARAAASAAAAAATVASAATPVSALFAVASALFAVALIGAAAGVRQPSGSALMIWTGTLACMQVLHGHTMVIHTLV